MKQRMGVRKNEPPKSGFWAVFSTSISSASAQPLPWDPCVQVSPWAGAHRIVPLGGQPGLEGSRPQAGGSGPGGVFSEGWQGCRVSQIWNQPSPYEPWAAPVKSPQLPLGHTVCRALCSVRDHLGLPQSSQKHRGGLVLTHTSYCDRKMGRTMCLPVYLLPGLL